MSSDRDRMIMTPVETRRMVYAALSYITRVVRLNIQSPVDSENPNQVADDTMRSLLEDVLDTGGIE